MNLNNEGKLALVVAVAVLAIFTMANSIIQSASASDFYSELPEKPNDFENIKYRIEKGHLTDICIFSERYYVQPDFYPMWGASKSAFYDNHDYSRWVVHGYGAYPATQGIVLSNLKAGESFEVCTVVRAAFGAETWQGIKLQPIENEYFDVEILNQEFEEYPNHYILEPTFPIFKDGWAKLIKFRITATQDVPVGTYNLGMNVVTPDDRFNKEMYLKIMYSSESNQKFIEDCIESAKENPLGVNKECERLFMERERIYVPGGSYQIDRNMFDYIVEVVE